MIENDKTYLHAIQLWLLLLLVVWLSFACLWHLWRFVFWSSSCRFLCHRPYVPCTERKPRTQNSQYRYPKTTTININQYKTSTHTNQHQSPPITTNHHQSTHSPTTNTPITYLCLVFVVPFPFLGIEIFQLSEGLFFGHQVVQRRRVLPNAVPTAGRVTNAVFTACNPCFTFSGHTFHSVDAYFAVFTVKDMFKQIFVHRA